MDAQYDTTEMSIHLLRMQERMCRTFRIQEIDGILVPVCLTNEVSHVDNTRGADIGRFCRHLEKFPAIKLACVCCTRACSRSLAVPSYQSTMQADEGLVDLQFRT